MEVKQPELPRLLGIGRAHPGEPLSLAHGERVMNHIGSVHASAQFALAELASGDFLRTEFAEYDGNVLPLLREANIRYRKVANSSLRARCHIEPEAAEAFVQRIDKRGRATIIVHVELLDEQDQVTAEAEYHWFIQRL